MPDKIDRQMCGISSRTISELEVLHNTDLGFPGIRGTKQQTLKAGTCNHSAGSFVKMKKSNVVYYSCEKCTQTGVCHRHKVTFLLVSDPLVTDAIFRHKQVISPFENLIVNMLSGLQWVMRIVYAWK